MIVNFTPEQMSRLCLMCNEFNRTTGLQLTVNDYLSLVVRSFMNGVRMNRPNNREEN